MIRLSTQNLELVQNRIAQCLYVKFSSTVKTENNVGSIPKKSSSLILFRKDGKKKGPFDYDIFFFKRHSKGSFSDMYAFPGGQLEQQDKEVEQNNECNKFLYCAIRETFEEIGLYFPKNSINESTLKEAVNQFKLRGLRTDDFKSLTKMIPAELSEDKFQTFIRLITVPQIKHRYDCIFYLHEMQKNNMINWFQYFKTGQKESIQDDENIILNEDEGVKYEWMNPLECIDKYYKKQLLLAPPQFIILNILSSFLKYEDLQNFLRAHQNSPKIDAMDQDPYSFPYLIGLQNTSKVNPDLAKEYPFTATVGGDFKYHLDKICAIEQDQQLKKELFDKISNLNVNENSRSRIYFKNPQKLFDFEYEVDFNFNQYSPLSHMKGYNQIQQLIKTHIKNQ
ncbi:hypothetical protein ABPG74_009710 [Tetrahymena malaccensis]